MKMNILVLLLIFISAVPSLADNNPTFQQKKLRDECPDVVNKFNDLQIVMKKKPPETGDEDKDITSNCHWMEDNIISTSILIDAVKVCMNNGHPSLFDENKLLQFSMQFLQNDESFKRCKEMGLIRNDN